MKVMEGENRPWVLVTGARGFIGRAVTKLLQRSGYQALGADQSEATDQRIGSEVCLDITDRGALHSLLESQAFSGIIHLAAILPTAARRDPLRATEVNVRGSLNVLEMAREFGVRRFVFGSSLSVYGTYPAGHVVTEADRAAAEDLYGAAKVYVEQFGEAYRAACGLEFVSLRIGRVVGPGAASATSAWRSQIFELLGTAQPAEIELPYADTERILVVHVEDVAKMLVTLLATPRPAHSVYNAVCESVAVGELKREVERLNPRLRVSLGGEAVVGNPRRLDSSRFGGEFRFEAVSIFELLRTAAGRRVE